VTKAIVLLDAGGVAMAPATLCAEAVEEARKLNLPLVDAVLAHLSAGKEMRTNGDTGYELYHEGQRVALLEIFETPCVDGAVP
jgi:hypothetical protein